MLKKIFLFASAIFVVFQEVRSQGCPNSCSGHGQCTNDLTCKCHFNKQQDLNGREFTEVTETIDGVEQTTVEYSDVEIERISQWTGADCSLMTCPRGTSWSKIAVVDGNVEHMKDVECSHQGNCDRNTGLCNCFEGFTGSACHRSTCPNNCNGHGECLSNVAFADVYSESMTERLNRLNVVASRSSSSDSWSRSITQINDKYRGYRATYSQAWDSYMNRGCLCDSGWTGPDCNKRECPSGNDNVDQNCKNEEGIEIVTSVSQAVKQLRMSGDFFQDILDESDFVDYMEEYYNTKTMVYRPKQTIEIHSHFTDQIRSCAPFSVPHSFLIWYQTIKGTVGHITAAQAKEIPIIPASSDQYKCSRATFISNIILTPYCGGKTSGQPCSGRGTCDTNLGTCACNEGYLGHNCAESRELS